MSIQLFNTLTRKKEEFTPLRPDHVRMYVCGPTVYSHPHIGNARPAVCFDLLFRLLKHDFKKVTYARNITDVDDKINQASIDTNTPIREITDKYTEIYHGDVGALGVQLPTIEPRATEHIEEMISLIEVLIDKGHAYEAEGHVLFKVQSFDDYGKLSRRSQDEMEAGARVEVAPFKEDPSDFVLWKPSTEDLPGWDSPWGRGRPGWHLECTTMIEKHLGIPFDIHGGGGDLVFPHHENEIAQGACSHGNGDYCRVWMHNGLIHMNNQKMSKSLGNISLVKDLLEEAPGEAIRLALLTTHYRKPLDWTDETLPQATAMLDKFYRALESAEETKVSDADLKVSEELLESLRDDLNTPKVFAVLHDLATQLNKEPSSSSIKGEFLASANFIGFLEKSPKEWFAEGANSELSEQEIEGLLKKRTDARANKDFETSDKIRDELKEKGIEIEDTPDGTKWRYVH